MLKLKRIHDQPGPDDGKRYLVDRVWPRGVRKADAHLDEWLKALAPSTELRKWFNHDPARWEDFQARYCLELEAPELRALLDRLASEAETGSVTLLYGAKDEQRNQAVVIRRVVEERFEKKAHR
ncbi:hypothetical protein PCS_00145 [Desulfocurvibacter africanus PCS]|uniref:DUF488 domain-containing protein n=1 Tax=Desulfocurvibacter africanus PCS TaxID=1262666 RepID=M5PW34_DESAF|nr:DUF488 family protein [Desulfocurvibacter africanus]EMG38517.1 hypothetical protein PCS_00145 [Desulfocurvibacter africanus PCS]